MAAAIGPVCGPVLSQKQRRAALRKERRKRKRKALAQGRESDLNNESCQMPEEDDQEDKEEEERRRLHEEWLERERVAQEEFRLKFEKEEALRLRREEEERLIKEEWEARQKKEEEEREQKKQKKQDREEAVQKMLDEAESQLEKGGGPWMNPEAPVTVNSDNYGTERDVANCPFFLKTGACRFGDRCSRKHVCPTSSTTLLIRSMFTTFGMEEARRDDYDIDACLEHSEEDLQEHFTEFYRDVLPEFRSVGIVVQFKVSCNYESHLRGNVYVQFETEEQCKEALIKFNGRWYAGRQLQCELCPVTRWKNAICGLFDRQKCPKGKHCNFLHVFRNPGNEFWEADRDFSPRRNRREGWYSERRSDRSWRQRSPPRSERSHSRVDGRERWRSTSRERRGKERGSWSNRSDQRSERNQSRSTNRERSRSRSRDRNMKSQDTDKSRTKNERRGSRDKNSRSRSRSRDKERHKRSRNHSPKEEDKESSPKDGGTHRRHKHSKKSKKKSKKKHKKRSRASPEAKLSSEDSEKESPPTASPASEGKQDEILKEADEEGKSSPAAASVNKDLNETFEDGSCTAL